MKGEKVIVLNRHLDELLHLCIELYPHYSSGLGSNICVMIRCYEHLKTKQNESRSARKGKRSRAEEYVLKTLTDQVVAAQGLRKLAYKGLRKENPLFHYIGSYGFLATFFSPQF